MPKKKAPAPVIKPIESDYFIKAIDPSRLSLYTKDGRFAGRFPSSFKDAIEGASSFSPKNQSPSPQMGDSNGTALSDPYTQKDKAAIEDLVLADGTALEAFMLLVKTILGKQLQVITDSRKYYPTEDERKQAVESILTNQEYKNLLIKIKEIDGRVKLRKVLAGSELQKYAFGRSAVGIVFKEGLPVELKPFSTRNMGTVYVDPETWQLLALDYHDLLIGGTSDKPRRISSDNFLYFTNLDYNVRANSLYYGIAKGKQIIGASIAKRIMIEEDLPEVMKGHWAGVGIIKAPGITSSAKLQTLINGMDPGKWNAINADVQMEVIKIATELDNFPLTMNELDRYIIRQVGVPIPLMPGYEDVTNRATIQEVVQVFKETRVAFQRSELQEQVDAQWYDTLLMELTGKPIEEIEYKVCTGFQDLIFDTTADKMEALAKAKGMGLPISDEAAFEMLGWDNLIDEIEDVKAEMMKEQKEKMKMEMGTKEVLNKKPAFGEGDR